MLLAALILLNLWVEAILGHPQCLDYRAPFEPERDLLFCYQYSDLGCCSTMNDDRIREEYVYIQSQVTKDVWARCRNFVKEILCQKCSPYAAHIYDAEGTSKARKFPGLCKRYCYTYFDECRSLTRLLSPGFELDNIISSRESFCQKVSLQDTDYCYPDLLTSPVLRRNWTLPLASDGPGSGCLCLEKINRNLANPLWARHAGDSTGRLFVAEQKGRVHIYDTKKKKWYRSCFMDISKRVAVSSWVGDERGFLGMAFHPDFSSNGRFFVYYSVKVGPDEPIPPDMSDYPCDTKIRISEFRVSADDPDKADMNSERVLLEVLQPHQNHNGGELLFGPDGYLYIFIGDGGGGGDPLGAGQNKSMLLGKVLRVDVDSSLPYAIPPDNPFVGQPGSRPEIYAYGVRNIWRCGVDRGHRTTGEFKGRILCGDVGQDTYEEINLLKKGANYGWDAREGFACYNMETCGAIGQEELPIHAYNHTFGKSVTGGVFYRGCENPSLDGQYIYGDYVSSRLFSLGESGGQWTNREVQLCGSSLCQGSLIGYLPDYILSFGEDEEGEIYMLTSQSSSSGKCDGKLYKIVDPFSRKDPATCQLDPTLRKRIRLPLRKQVPERQGEPFGNDRFLSSKSSKDMKSSHHLNRHNKLRRRLQNDQQRDSQFISEFSGGGIKRKTKKQKKFLKTLRKNENMCGCL
ncbi:HHIP-like protein 1 [Bulinus truncatus]|nr:HHIP-like protein 1 [Bulinus truncatus]